MRNLSSVLHLIAYSVDICYNETERIVDKLNLFVNEMGVHIWNHDYNINNENNREQTYYLLEIENLEGTKK